MDFTEALRGLKRRWKWVLIGVLPALYLALGTAYHVGLSGLHKKNLQYGSASTSLLVDSEQSTLVQTNANVSQLSDIAQVFGEFYNTPTLQADIAGQLGIPPRAVAISVDSVNPNLPTDLGQNVGQRNTGLLQESDALQLVVVPEPSLPLITLYAQGPNGAAAAKLANAGAQALRDYLSGLPTYSPTKAEVAKAAALGVTPPARVTVRQLGPARGGMVDSGANTSIVLLAFLGLLIVDCVIVIMLGGFIERYRRAVRRDQAGPRSGSAAGYGPAMAAESPISDEPVVPVDWMTDFGSPDGDLSRSGGSGRRLIVSPSLDEINGDAERLSGAFGTEADAGETARRAGVSGRLSNSLSD